MALNNLNEALSSNYTLSRLGEWRNGMRSVPEPVQRYMLQLALPHILREYGISLTSLDDNFINPIADALMPPCRHVSTRLK